MGVFFSIFHRFDPPPGVCKFWNTHYEVKIQTCCRPILCLIETCARRALIRWKRISAIGLTSSEKNRTNYPKIPLEYGIFLHFTFIRFSQFASAAVRPLFLGQPFCKTGELLEQQEGGAQVLQCPFFFFWFCLCSAARRSVVWSCPEMHRSSCSSDSEPVLGHRHRAEWKSPKVACLLWERTTT